VFLDEVGHQEGDEGAKENLLNQSHVNLSGSKCGDHLGPATIGEDRSTISRGGQQRVCVQASEGEEW
jgi:hypothetical protein